LGERLERGREIPYLSSGPWVGRKSTPQGAYVRADLPLPPEQEAEAQRLFALLQQPFLDEARRSARLLASTPDAPLLGRTAFEGRDAVHRLAAPALQAALQERNKGGTRAPA
jgi:hypothetical protein